MYLSVKIILKAKKNKGKCCQRMNRNDKKRSSVLSNRAGAHIKEVVNKFTTLLDGAMYLLIRKNALVTLRKRA